VWAPRSVRLRPMAFSAGAVALVTAATATGFAVVNGNVLEAFARREQAQVSADRDLLASVYATSGFERTRDSVRLEALHASSSQFFGLFSPGDHRRLAGNIRTIPEPFAPRRGATGVARDAAGRPVRMFALGAYLPNGAVMVVGRDVQAEEALRRALRDGVLIAFSIVIASSLVVGIVLSAIVTGRAETIAAMADRIASGQLDARAGSRPGRRLRPYRRGVERYDGSDRGSDDRHADHHRQLGP
jgi:hypothetical protein